MAVKEEVDNQIRQVIEEMLGLDSGVSLQYGRPGRAGLLRAIIGLLR